MEQLLWIRNKTSSKGIIIIKNTKDFLCIFAFSVAYSQEGTKDLFVPSIFKVTISPWQQRPPNSFPVTGSMVSFPKDSRNPNKVLAVLLEPSPSQSKIISHKNSQIKQHSLLPTKWELNSPWIRPVPLKLQKLQLICRHTIGSASTIHRLGCELEPKLLLKAPRTMPVGLYQKPGCPREKGLLEE